MQTASQQIAKRRLLIFFAFLFVFSADAYFFIFRIGYPPLYTLGLMWAPGLAAIFASVFAGRPLKDIGWWPGRPKWLLLGWLSPMMYALPAYLLVWVTGLGGFPNPTFLERARSNLNMSAARPDWLVIIAAYGFIAVMLALLSIVATLGEEIGWRGFWCQS